MKTPIVDFVKEYSDKNALRLHMPGHKGKKLLGCESFDITEINGADSLFEADGIIKESEKNASALFGADTFYSAEGSSLCIRAMLYLSVAGEKEPLVLAGRNAHKTFLTASAFLGFDVEWLCPDNNQSYLSCLVSGSDVEKGILNSPKKPSAVYITSPDYLGNISPIEEISAVCKKYKVPLLVDNAHGAYLRFLSPSLHPVELGADMCCDSAHKTLPCLTGGAYLHVSNNAKSYFKQNAKEALSVFASTSPSYLILQSLDETNKYISDGYEKKLSQTVLNVEKLKKSVSEMGFELFGNEPLKLTVAPKSFGYTGSELSDILESKNITCEFSDKDFLVLMFTPEINNEDFNLIETAFHDVERKERIFDSPPSFRKANKQTSVREALLSEKELVPVEMSVGRIIASPSVGCPPAVPIAMCGEMVDEDVVKAFLYYGVDKCFVIK